MTQRTVMPPKRPSLLSLIINDVREVLRRDRQQREFTRAHELLVTRDSAAMERLAERSLGDAWLALADHYTSDFPEDPARATEAYRRAAECNEWISRTSRAEEEFDRRHFLGIGITQDFGALAKKWKNMYESGSQRETQLAWIHSFGPADLRDLEESWWWVALAEERWGQFRDADLPTMSAGEVHAHLVKSVPKQDRLRIQRRAKEYSYQDFVRGK
jgi:hypothetical protein